MQTNINNILDDIADKFFVSIDYRLGDLFDSLDSILWKETNHNPKLFLTKFDKTKLDSALNKIDLTNILEIYYKINSNAHNDSTKKVAYFSPEFGIHESLANYAGGLGILAGDIIKTANIENTSFFGVGLMYKYGYFQQIINNNNTQKSVYNEINYNNHPTEPLLDKSGNEFIIKINLNTFDLYIKPYKLKINNTFIILLNTDLPENGIYAKITDNLYTGSRELRLLQEITLGIGGVKALEKAGINYDILHINEGHAAFALLEKVYIYSKNNNLSINESIEFLANSNVFTTHTPVIHGNEEFHLRIIRKYLTGYIEKTGLTFGQFVQFGKANSVKNSKFSMTCLAINLSGKINAVSQLHTETANQMWEEILNKKNPKQKIVGVTNGIHINSWFAKEFNDLLKINIDEKVDIEKLISKISDIDIIKTKSQIQKKMINQLLSIMKIRSSEKRYLDFINSFKDDRKYLIFGFARRFAKYKRADLIFSNIKRLKELFENRNVNIRFIFSGKAHPKDTDGKAILSNLLNLIDDNNLNEFCHFIPDYDIEVGRLLVQGSDIWLNTPVKPLEACGTSGMKSALNFGINLSITDGWWYEAYNKRNGIGVEDDDNSVVVCNRILDALENIVIPFYYADKSKLRVSMMKNSFITAFTKFSSERMLKDYNDLYFD